MKTEKSRRFSEQRPVCVCLYHNKTWPSTIDNSRYVRRLILPYLPRHNCFASKIVAKKPSCICAIFADYTRARIIVVINDYIEWFRDCFGDRCQGQFSQHLYTTRWLVLWSSKTLQYYTETILVSVLKSILRDSFRLCEAFFTSFLAADYTSQVVTCVRNVFSRPQTGIFEST